MVFVATLRGEEGGIVHLPVNGEGDDYLLCLTVKTLAYLDDGTEQQILVGFFELTFIFVRERLVYCAVGYVHIVYKCILAVIVVIYAEYIDICYGVTHHLALGAELFYHHILTLQLFSLLELHFLGLAHHLVIYHLAQFSRVSLQYLPCHHDILLVCIP